MARSLNASAVLHIDFLRLYPQSLFWIKGLIKTRHRSEDLDHTEAELGDNMMNIIRTMILTALAVGWLAIGQSSASPISVMVGDNDGYGAGIADNGSTAGLFDTFTTDNRSAAEAAATNGAQFTDFYGFSPDGTIILPFAGLLTSATLTIDMADFQSSTFGAILADINGVALPFSFDDGFRISVVRDFVLSGSQIAAANLDGAVRLNLARNGSGDFIGFDYFRLTGNVSETPLPAALPLFLTMLGGMGFLKWRRRKATRIA